MIRVTRVSSDKVNIAAEHQEPAEVLSQLGNTSTPQISGSKSVASVAASGVLVAASGVVCNRSLFSLEIALRKRSACKAGLLMLCMSVKLTRVTRVLLPNKLLE